MATTTTYAYPKSIREDLEDIIYNIAPTRTPCMNNIGRGSCDNTFHEWQTDVLAAADANNARVEGADAVDLSFTVPSRVGNYTQISDKVINVTGTSGSVDTAGMKTLEAYWMAKVSRELKRDMEAIITANTAVTVGNSSTARKLAGIPAWLATNPVANGGTAPTLSASPHGYPNAAWTGGSAVAPTETMLKTAIQNLWKNGGEPKMCMVGPVNKVKLSAFTGIASNRIVPTDGPKQTFIIGAADVYVSDFGNIDIVPNLFQPESFLFLLDPDYVSINYLRGFQRNPLARTGDSKRTQILCEYTLKVHTERAHGGINNLLTT
jgi:Family of unknown function (DUF5309)